MKKIIATLLLSFFVITSPKTYAFDDVHPGDWYYTYVTEASEEGLIQGYADGSFQPDGNVTLAEFSTMLANAFYGTTLDIVSEETFPEWWEPYVYSTYLRDGLRFTTVDLSIQDYFDRGYLFNRWIDYVHAPLTRNDMASIVSNLLIDRYVTRYNEAEAIDAVSHFLDVTPASDYGISIAMAYDAQLITGKSPSQFLGDSLMTRAEATVVLSALLAHDLVELERYTEASMVLESSAFNASSYDVTGHLFLENYIFARTNELRVAKGLNSLEHRDALVDYALIRSMETTSLFSHTRPDGTLWNTVFPDTDTINKASGENLTMGSGFQYFQFADMIFKAWLNSPGHYTNMLDSRHTTLGVAVYVDMTGAYYATQIFGRD